MIETTERIQALARLRRMPTTAGTRYQRSDGDVDTVGQVAHVLQNMGFNSLGVKRLLALDRIAVYGHSVIWTRIC